MADDFERLIARLEAATGPDRELDAAIFCYRYEGFALVEGDVLAIQGGFKARVSSADLPRYTASLDDALTLVPEEWAVSIIFLPSKDASGSVAGPENWASINSGVQHPGATPAIALCIAAIRAHRIAQAEGGQEQ